MPPPSRAVSFLLATAVAAAAAAQCPPGAPMPGDLALESTVPEQGPAKVRWQAGQDARKSGDLEAARRHLANALEFHPSSPAILLDLALACQADADTGPLWAERYVRAAADAQGRLKPDAATRKLWAASAGFEAALKPAGELAAVRAAALAEVAKFVERNKPEKKGNAARAVLVRWASELLLEAGLGAPAALGAVAPAVGRVHDAFEPDHQLVFEALVRVLQKKPAAAANGAPTTGPDADQAKVQDQRVRAARILVGLRRQGGFQDLQGPPPPALDKYADEAQKVLDEHAATAVAAAKVWTIAELAALTPAEAEAFTQSHRDWRAPGIATSPNGRYRIETVCGYHTLLGAARTIELHHARLVHHFGNDPFTQRQGLVRIVPEASDLETEGAPYWWAGGFQSGDRTTVRFAWSDIASLGRTLTHELTHRFDGVLRPFLPAWYAEGHADWTSGHYGRMAEPQCAENFLKVHTAAHTWYKGYGNRDRFEQLLKGEIADYRDNYFAGYSLYAFLRSYPPGAPRYRSALDQYERNARGGQKDRVGYFAATFADGKQGRPASLDELFTEWQGFLRGCYERLDPRTQKPENAWVERYGGVDAEGGERVKDEPTWSWARHRHEPFFGQDHAVAATLLLHEVGDFDGTVAAGLWATRVDGWRVDTAAAVLAALRAGKNADAAAAFANIAHRRFPTLPAIGANGLLAALPRSKALLDALALRAEALTATAPSAAAATAADHARLATLFGLEPLPPRGKAPVALPRHLGGHGFIESSLVGFDERRTRGLWYTTSEGDVHVGREKPRESTGTLDRHAHQRDAFVHTVAWQAPGTYVIRGRIHLTTSYASGAIVFGHGRRDRDLRLTFSSGDFDYATGRSDSNAHAGHVNFGLQGLWERDGKLPSVPGDHGIDVPPDNPSFEFALYIRGPRVLVEIDGKAMLRYAVHDGTPIEGHVGFATGMGAIRVQQPTVQRRDDAERGVATDGLALDRQPDHALDELLLLPTRGIPLSQNGTLVLWLPKVAEGSPIDGLPRALPALAKMLDTPHEHPQTWVLAVPKDLPAAARAAAQEAIGAIRKEPMPVAEHVVGEPFDGSYPWVLFVDAQGVLRAAAAVNDPQVHSKVAGWARWFRGRR